MHDEYTHVTAPFVPIRGFVVFPQINMGFEARKQKAVDTVQYAMECQNNIVVATQMDASMDASIDEPSVSDCYKTGVLVEVVSITALPNNVFRVNVSGLKPK